MIYKQCNYSILLLLYDFEFENVEIKLELELETWICASGRGFTVILVVEVMIKLLALKKTGEHWKHQ